MKLGSGEHSYEWIDNWARIPDTESGRANGRTHAVAVTGDGRIIVFNQADPAVLIYNAAGMLIDAWGDRFAGAHGLTLVQEGDSEYLWLTDHISGEVAKTTLDGKTVMNISKPDLPAYREGKYAPTWVAANEERNGGNGDVFVADGYGSNYVHRYDKHGTYLNSINGTEGGAGAFNCPHGVWFDTRKQVPELYIADRANGRIQVYDGEGNFKRACAQAALGRPCGFANNGTAEYIVIPEYRDEPRVTILDGNDELICYLGENAGVNSKEGWPNNRALVQPGLFNSPHGAAVDRDGNIYIVEWITGGRITKLAKC